jgi:hypothetical protein
MELELNKLYVIKVIFGRSFIPIRFWVMSHSCHSMDVFDLHRSGGFCSLQKLADGKIW